MSLFASLFPKKLAAAAAAPAPTGDLLNVPLQLTGELDLEAASQPSGGKGPPRFTLLAYSGQPIRVAGFDHPVIIDLSGAAFEQAVTPVIADHDTGKRIGHTVDQQINRSGIYASGVVSSTTAEAQSIVADAKAGFPFQVSVGAVITSGEFVREGETATVNGQQHAGPLIVARTVTIRELSITVLGADSKTAAAFAANHRPTTPPSGTENDMSRLPTTAGFAGTIGNSVANPADRQAILNAERQRIQTIEAMLQPPSGGDWGNVQDQIDQLRMRAINEEIRLADLPNEVLNLAQLQAMRSSLPTLGGPAIHTRGGVGGAGPGGLKVLEAALARHVKMDIGKHYGEQVATEASRLPVTSLMDVLKLGCQALGLSVDFRNKDAVIRAAVSSNQIGTLLNNVQNKVLEDSIGHSPAWPSESPAN